MATRWGCGAGNCLLERRPERLVVLGYRHWLAGYDTGSIDPWEMAWTLFAGELGAADGRATLATVADWVRELRARSDGSPRFYPHSCRWLCRDECLALAAVSALQHGDPASATVSLAALGHGGTGCGAGAAAGSVADQLFHVGQVLMPVPPAVIEDIVSRPPRDSYH